MPVAASPTPRLAPVPAPWPLGLALAWTLPLALAAWLVLLLGPPLGPREAAMAGALVLLPAAGLWMVARAGTIGGGALVLLAGATVLLSDMNLPGRGGEGLDAQSALKFGLWALGLMLALWRWPDLRLAASNARSGFLGCFALWCLASSVWSVTPLYTAAASVALLGMWVVASALATAVPERTGLQVFGGALGLALALTLALYVAAPGLAMTPMENGRLLRLSGVFASPNNLGRAAALALLVACLLLPHAKRAGGLAGCAALAALGGACLHLSDSRGSTFALAVALAVAVLGQRRWLALALCALLASLVLATMAWGELGRDLLGLVSRSGRIDEVSTLTGRTAIWEAVIGLIGREPWLGHGFASTREVIPAVFEAGYGWTTTSAHNLWLQAWVTTGLVGLALVLVAQGAWLREALMRPHRTRDALIAFVLVVGLLEASALGPSVNLMTFVWCWAAALASRRQDA